MPERQKIPGRKTQTLALEDKTVLSIAPSDLKSNLKRLVPFMSNSELRHDLCGVYFCYSKGELILCATNGHILCEIKVGMESREEGDFRLTLPASAVKDLIKVMPSSALLPVILIKVSKDSKEIEFQSPDFSYGTLAMDGVFPNYQDLIPRGDIKMREGMRAGYLISALKALGNTPVDISVDDSKNASNAPHLLTSDKAQGIRCVIMPVSVD